MNAGTLETHPSYLDMMFRWKTCEWLLENENDTSPVIAHILFYQVRLHSGFSTLGLAQCASRHKHRLSLIRVTRRDYKVRAAFTCQTLTERVAH